jgi:hypothetical protein
LGSHSLASGRKEAFHERVDTFQSISSTSKQRDEIRINSASPIYRTRSIARPPCNAVLTLTHTLTATHLSTSHTLSQSENGSISNSAWQPEPPERADTASNTFPQHQVDEYLWS